jgi:hypothetical protein
MAYNGGNEIQMTLLLCKSLDMFNEYSSLLLIKREHILLIWIDLFICPIKYPVIHSQNGPSVLKYTHVKRQNSVFTHQSANVVSSSFFIGGCEFDLQS